MAESGPAELLAHERVDPIVLTEHEPARERLLIGVEPGAERCLGTAANPVEGTREAGASTGDRADSSDGELERGSRAPELVGAEVVRVTQTCRGRRRPRRV